MLYFVVIGLFLAILSKRNPLTIMENVQFRLPWLMIGCLFIQIGLELLVKNYFHRPFPVVLFLSFCGMIVGLYYNRHIKGLPWVLGGTVMNILALATHQGLMPVSETAVRMTGLEHLLDYNLDSRHQAMQDTLFWWLGDWIPVFTPIGSNFILSPGDVVVGIGLIIFCIFNSSKRSNY